MLIRLDDPTFVDDLCAHYRRSGFTAVLAGENTVEVRSPDVPDSHLERSAILMHLSFWQVMNPGAKAEPAD